MTYVESLKKKNLFYAEPNGPRDGDDINRFISVYGGSEEIIDFIGNGDRTLELLWELVTAKCGSVKFEYTIGACIVTGGGNHGTPQIRTTGNSIGRALANLFIEYMRLEATGKHPLKVIAIR